MSTTYSQMLRRTWRARPRRAGTGRPSQRQRRQLRARRRAPILAITAAARTRLLMRRCRGCAGMSTGMALTPRWSGVLPARSWHLPVITAGMRRFVACWTGMGQCTWYVRYAVYVRLLGAPFVGCKIRVLMFVFCASAGPTRVPRSRSFAARPDTACAERVGAFGAVRVRFHVAAHTSRAGARWSGEYPRCWTRRGVLLTRAHSHADGGRVRQLVQPHARRARVRRHQVMGCVHDVLYCRGTDAPHPMDTHTRTQLTHSLTPPIVVGQSSVNVDLRRK